MAKQTKTVDDEVLDGLSKALDSLPAILPLSGSKSVFAAKQKGAAEAAVAAGYFTVEPRKVGKKFVDHAVLTEAGIRRVVGHGSPKDALETLSAAVQRLQQSDRPAANPEVFRAELAKATDTCVGAIRSAFEQLQAAVMNAVAPAGAPAVDVNAVLSAVQEAVGRVEPQIVRLPAPTVAPPAPPAVSPPLPAPAPVSATTNAAELEDDIVWFVERRAAETTGGSLFDVLFAEVRAKHPDLSEGAFQDALRRLDRQQRIRLGGWPKSPHDLPVPELAMFLAHRVMYYAHPIR